MKTLYLIILTLVLFNIKSQTSANLDINQIRASVGINGSLFGIYSPSLPFVGFEAPIGSGKSWCSSANIWIGGYNTNSNLHVVASNVFNQSSYLPGPLILNAATTYSFYVNQFSRVWKLNKSDIEDFIINYQNGNFQNGTYTAHPDIINWPGNGDTLAGFSRKLAPYFDNNNDNWYNANDGDYPIIKGDQTIYSIFNDLGATNFTQGGLSLGVEIHLMAYAIGDCGYSNATNSVLKYTTFYNYKIFNRSNRSYNNTYISHFNDADIGFYSQNRTGCHVIHKYGYTYNPFDTISANMPYLATVLLKGPVSDNDGIDNNADGMADEPGEQVGMTNYMYFNNSFPGVPLTQTDPQNGIQYYQYMQSAWRDGTHLTCGGDGYGGSVPTNYAFPADTYSNGPCGNGNWMEQSNVSDKRTVLSSGGFNFLPGEMKEVEYAYVLCFDSINRNHYNKLEAEVTQLHQLYSNGLGACNATSLQERSINNTCKAFPNPTTDFIELNCSGKKVTSVFITNVLGEIIKKQDVNSDKIDLSELVPGIYFVSLLVDKSSSIIKVIKH